MQLHRPVKLRAAEFPRSPSSLSFSLSSLVSLPPFYFTALVSLACIRAPFYRHFKSSWNSINLSTLLIHHHGVFVQVERAPFFSLSILARRRPCSFSSIFSFSLLILFFIVRPFASVNTVKIHVEHTRKSFQKRSRDRHGNDINSSSIRERSRA